MWSAFEFGDKPLAERLNLDRVKLLPKDAVPFADRGQLPLVYLRLRESEPVPIAFPGGAY